MLSALTNLGAWLVAARLLVPAASLTFSRSAAAAFVATGLPAWMRLALAVPEMMGALLFVIPATLVPGAAVLAVDLAAAIAVHIYLGIWPRTLFLLLAVVLGLTLVRRSFLPWTPRP